MAKNERHRGELDDQEEFYWLMTTAYVLMAVGLLDKQMEQKLDSLVELDVGNWQDHVRDALGVDVVFIRSIYAHCSEFWPREQAVEFILRGFGCPRVKERLVEFGLNRQ